MPGFLLHDGATVQCAHGGRGKPIATNPKVSVSKQQTVFLSMQWSISGCANPPSAGGPCTMGTFTVGTTRVTSNSQPLAIFGGTGTCIPTGVPLLTISSQTKVTGT